MAKTATVNPEFKDDRVLVLLSPPNVLKLPFFTEHLPVVFPGADIVAPKDVEHLCQIVERSHSTHRLVLAVGGDGTLHQALQRLVLESQVLGVLPSGTGNDVARILDYPRQLTDRIARLSEMRSRPMDFGVINNQRFINSGGFGIDSDVLNTMRMGKGFISRNYNAAFINTLLRLQAVKAAVRHDEGEVTDSFFWVLAMNTPYIGGGTQIAPRAVVDDGRLDLLLVREMSRLNLLRFMPAALKGRHLNLAPVAYTQTRSVKITMEQPVDYIAVDGELVFCGKREISIETRSGQLKFLR